MVVGDVTDRYNPYADALPTDLKLKTKSGILSAWAARANQYWQEKNPLATYCSEDVNKFQWTLNDIWNDPVGTVIGRYIMSEEEIEAQLKWKDQEETALTIKKHSDYQRIVPTGTALSGRFRSEADFEKSLTHHRLQNNFQPFLEVEGETYYERRLTWDFNYWIHRLSLGWIKYDPFNSRTSSPGKTGYSSGVCIPEKPTSGPNIRGRYARDLRGDQDVIYEFTNEDDWSNLGSDTQSRYRAKRALNEYYTPNKFLNKEDLD